MTTTPTIARMVRLMEAAKAQYDAETARALDELQKYFGIDGTLNEHGQIEVTREQFAHIRTIADGMGDPRVAPSPLTGVPIVVRATD